MSARFLMAFFSNPETTSHRMSYVEHGGTQNVILCVTKVVEKMSPIPLKGKKTLWGKTMDFLDTPMDPWICDHNR